MKQTVILLFSIALLSSCSKQKSVDKSAASTENYEVQYAQGFSVVKTKDYTHITVNNPWDSTAILQSYVLVDRAIDLPANLPKGTIVRTPIATAAATSATQCTTLNELNSLGIIIGVCEPQYINIKHIKQGVADGSIEDLGMASNPSSEAIILLSPEVFFVDPVTGQSRQNIERTKIPIVQTPDYTEPHPLGRAEWIRFYSLFVGQEALADSLFAITAKNYNDVKSMVSAANNKPSVFLDTRYQGSWNVAGGKSYISTILADAGAEYLWADNESTTFMPLSFEAVLDKAGNGDKWLIRYYSDKDMTYNSLEKEYKPYSYFKAFKDKNVYGCNTMNTTYYEDLPIHPDYILKDLAHAFHPDLFPEYKARYYKPLEE